MRSVFWRVLVVVIALLMPANMRSQSLTGTNLTSGGLPSFPCQDGWIGGDAGYSILLESGKSRWLLIESQSRSSGLIRLVPGNWVDNFQLAQSQL
jgi:hypothetical protein